MIKTCYYSTLNDAIYETKEEAESAEDRYIQSYFEELDRVAQIKRRKRQMLVNGISSEGFGSDGRMRILF